MTSSFPLSHATPGQNLQVEAIEDDETATLAMRLGIAIGSIVQLVTKVPGGPLVIRKDSMEIALGRTLCQGIQVSYPTPSNTVLQ